MAFIDQRLPEEIELGAVRREVEDLEIVRTDGGQEVRNIHTSQARYEYDISFPPGEFDESIRSQVKTLFKASRGGLIAFRLRDWDVENNTLTDETIGFGDGAATTFQMTKTWTADGEYQERVITRPVAPIVVKKDGVVQGAGVSVNMDTGLVTFLAAPANGVEISVSGLYDIPVRFDGKFEGRALTGWLEHIETMTLVEDIE